MREQKITEKGHLEELFEIINELNFLHNSLYQIQQNKAYISLFEAAEPNIEILRRKTPNATLNLVETCLNGVYGLLVLKLKKKQITQETTIAIASISKVLGYLAKEYKSYKNQ